MISLLLPIVQLLVLTSLTLKMFTKSQSLKFFQTFFRSICRICKDIFAGVILVKYFFKYIAVMNGRWSNFVLANKFVLNVYFYMVFAAKVILSIFLNPISISIFMTAFFLTPIFWNFPVLYLPVFLSAITLFWSCCDRSINNLTFLSLKSALSKITVKVNKKFFYCSLKSHIVLASGTESSIARLRKRMKESLSLLPGIPLLRRSDCKETAE